MAASPASVDLSPCVGSLQSLYSENRLDCCCFQLLQHALFGVFDIRVVVVVFFFIIIVSLAILSFWIVLASGAPRLVAQRLDDAFAMKGMLAVEVKLWVLIVECTETDGTQVVVFFLVAVLLAPQLVRGMAGYHYFSAS